MDVMAGYAANPNVYGTVVVSLGCENCQMDLVVKAIQERTNKPLKQVIIQEAGGTLKAIDMARPLCQGDGGGGLPGCRRRSSPCPS